MSKDYYTILNISRAANREDIKKAYRKLAHQYHPDKTGGDDKKFKEINEAYQVLSDPNKRSNYDNFGYAYNDGGFQGSPFGGAQGYDFSSIWDLFGGGKKKRSSGGFEDIFEIFSDAFSGGAYAAPREESERGEDIFLEVPLAKKDLGKRRFVEFEAFNNCKDCSGSGVAQGYKMSYCSACGGAGQIKHTSQSGFGVFTRVSVCPSCRGKGRMPEKRCDGAGRVKAKRKIEIQIPEDITDAYNIILPKQGNAGKNGQASGDLAVNLRIK